MEWCKTMKSITKYSRKLKLTYAKSALVICGLAVVAFPWFGRLSSADEGYYSVVLNGEKLGAVSDASVADDAYLEARLMIESENDASVYIEYDLAVYEEDKLYGDKISEEELAHKMYSVLKESSVEVKEKAYVVNVEGFMVTLSSKEEVVELLNAAKSKYDDKNEFTTILTDGTDSRFSYISYEFVKLGTEAVNTPVVLASGYGNTSDIAGKDEKSDDGLLDIGFQQDVEIIETYVSASQINSLDEAVELVTKEKEENKIYEVVQGDTLSGIANQFSLTLDEILAMNPDFSEEGYIQIGDRLNVTIPEPELSVVVDKQETYEESYNLPVEYVYNDSQYTTYSNVLSEGTAGYRQVVADVTYVNGLETARVILDEQVISEATARVVEVGTVTPPTFIKPLSGGTLTSGYGARWGSFHRGVDWSCSTGTSIMASSGGTIIQAGWNGTYGYSITISHGNGVQTRYAHLSRVLVNVGEYVKQGTVIGRSGNTGNSTGPHLHFEVIINGSRVNPFSYLY